jgi:hypothetical protein
MKKEFIPYELALELKQLGFDEPCLGYWYTEQEEFKKIDIQLSSIGFLEGEPDYILAPTFSQCFRWFREKYNLGAIVSQFGYAIENKYGQATKFEEDRNHLSYEESEFECLKKLIKLIKKGNK